MYRTDSGEAVTEYDGESGDWGVGQNFWAPDGRTMTQVLFGQDGTGDWTVMKEVQYETAGGNLFPRYVIEYTGCVFCPGTLAQGANIRSSEGVAQWTEFTSTGKVAHGPSPVPWRYDVVLNSDGTLLEIYHEKGALAYARETAITPGHGDTRIKDYINGLIYATR